MRPICIEPVPALSPICRRLGTEEIREAIDTDFDRSGAAVLRGGTWQMGPTFRKRARARTVIQNEFHSTAEEAGRNVPPSDREKG